MGVWDVNLGQVPGKVSDVPEYTRLESDGKVKSMMRERMT